MCKLADRIEQAIADGIYKPAQEQEQLKRLKIVREAYDRGGDEAADLADERWRSNG